MGGEEERGEKGRRGGTATEKEKKDKKGRAPEVARTTHNAHEAGMDRASMMRSAHTENHRDKIPSSKSRRVGL